MVVGWITENLFSAEAARSSKDGLAKLQVL